jgi:hypothetical protein
MTTRSLNKYKNLFNKYDELCEEQDNLYYGLILPEENKKKFAQLQIKKLSILEEMDVCLCKPITLSQSALF